MVPGLTPAAQARALSFERVADALDAAAYRVTLMRDGIGMNYTRPNKEEPEALLHRGELAEKLGALARLNAQGWNVYITPLDPHQHYLVIDDIQGRDGLQALRERGYTPALLQESSPGNYQGIVRVPKEPGSPVEREAANAWVRDVNRELGDEKFSGAVHPFRLAGFTNRKEKYAQPNGHFPFVKLVETPGVPCPTAAAELGRLRQERQELAGPGATDAAPRPGVLPRPDELSPRAVERYAQHRSDVEAQVHRRGWTPDESRIDFEVARRLVKEKVPLHEVAMAIEVGSPDLSRRHPDTWTYASTTAQRALEDVGRAGAERSPTATPNRGGSSWDKDR